MKMCNDMNLVLPDSAVIMNDNEMLYVEGGESYDKTLSKASTYFKNTMAVAAIGDLASVLFVVGTYGASALTGAYFTSVIASAKKCYNKCQDWLDTYSGSKSTVTIGCTTAYGFITDLTVKSKKLVK